MSFFYCQKAETNAIKTMMLLSHFPWTFSNIDFKSNLSANTSVAEIIHCSRDTRLAREIAWS